MRAGRKNTKMSLDFTFCTERVEQAVDGILRVCQHTGDSVVERTDPVGLDSRLNGPNRASAAQGGEGSLAVTSDDGSPRSHGQTRR